MTTTEQSLRRKIKTLQLRNNELRLINEKLQQKLRSRFKQDIQTIVSTGDICDMAYATIAELFNVDIGERSREREIVIARQYYHNYIRSNTGLSLKRIGGSIRGLYFDHSTVIHSINEFEKYYEIEPTYRDSYDRFTKQMEVKIKSQQETINTL